MIKYVERFGDYVLYVLEQVGWMATLLFKSLYAFAKPPYDLFAVVRQIHFIGARSLYVILVAGGFTGIVYAPQHITARCKYGG